MHGTSGGAPVPINSYGGLVTLADASSVPEGASPRTYDTDFLVGEVHSRPGLRSDYAYEGVITPKNPGGAAVATGGEITTLENANGQLWQTISRPLDNANHFIVWENFVIPPGNTLPSDAVIQGIWPVVIASSRGTVGNEATHRLIYNGSLQFTVPFVTNALPNINFPSTLFYDVSVGTTLSVLTGATIEAAIDGSLHRDDLTDYMNVTAAGFAIIY